MSYLIVGIDPGKKGGLSRLLLTGDVAHVQACVMPLNHNKVIDLSLVSEWLLGGPPHMKVLVVIEKQSPRPMQGVRRAGVMMEEYGKLLGLIHPANVLQVLPKTWQAIMLPNCPSGQTKARSLEYVRQKYPMLELRRTPRCELLHDGMSDAVLLAEYGRRMYL